MHMNWLTSLWWMQSCVQCSGRLGKSATAMVCSLEWTKQDLCGLLAKGKLATTHYCLVHVVTFTFISILVLDCIQKRGQARLLWIQSANKIDINFNSPTSNLSYICWNSRYALNFNLLYFLHIPIWTIFSFWSFCQMVPLIFGFLDILPSNKY